MCRKNQVQGICLLCLGLGMILGHCLDSWVISCWGGLILMVLGFWILRKR